MVVGGTDVLHQFAFVHGERGLLTAVCFAPDFFVVPDLGVDERQGKSEAGVVEVVGEELFRDIGDLREGVALRELVERAVHRVHEVAHGDVDFPSAVGIGVVGQQGEGWQEESACFAQGGEGTFERDGLLPEAEVGFEAGAEEAVERALGAAQGGGEEEEDDCQAFHMDLLTLTIL